MIRPDTLLDGAPVREVRGHDILDGKPERLENRDVSWGATAFHLAGEHLAQLTDDVRRAEDDLPGFP